MLINERPTLLPDTFEYFLSSADCFQNYHSKKNISGIVSLCQTVWIQSSPTFCGSWSGFKLVANTISRRQGKAKGNLTNQEFET